MERAVVFEFGGEELVGILHEGAPAAERGVLVVVGGPQYRVGSHRQFLLLARGLAAAGVPVFRFDYRGMGDASGPIRDFEHVRQDIEAAIDVFMVRSPGLRQVVIWGLCDAASAALDYGWRDRRVAGLVLLNPWVRTQEGLAKAYLKHYYVKRLLSGDFWSKLLRGRLNPVASMRSLAGTLALAASGTASGEGQAGAGRPAAGAGIDHSPLAPGEALPARMAEGWKRFSGPVTLILSGDDLTAAEFRDVAAAAPAWQGLLDQPRVRLRELPEANHTFSRREWREKVVRWTLEAVRPSEPGR